MKVNSTILVADGDSAMRTVIRDILSGKGYRVKTVSGLDEALAAMADGETGLAFLAYDLEDGEGNTLRRAAAGAPLPVPVVLVVDASLDDPVAAARECGALTYLKKPVDRSRLLMAAGQGLAAGELAARLAARESDLARMRAFLRGVADCGDGSFFVLDAKGVVVECGGRIGELPGADAESAPGRPYLSLLSESTAELHEGILERARLTGEPARIEEHRGGVVAETVARPVAEGGVLAGYVVARRDITARRRSEAGLAENEERYRNVFEGADWAVLILDRESGLIAAANKAAARALGYERDELPGVAVEDLAARPESLLGGLERGVERISLCHLRRKDGSSFPVEISLSYYICSGREMAILYALDVSRRKVVEEALREGARLYRAVVEDQTELICRYGPDGKLTFVNGAYARFFGDDEDEVVGNDCFVHFASMDRWRLAEWLGRADPSEPVLDCEVRQLRADGEMRWIQWTSRAVLDERRSVVEVQAVGRDVTERKDAERALDAATQEKEQYRLNLIATLKSIPDAIMTVDSDLVIVASNNAAADLFAFDRQRMRGRRLEDVVTGEGNPCVGVLKQVLATRKAVRGYEIELETPTLGERMVEINCSPLVGRERHAGAVLVVRDVSRVADLEKKLQQRHGFRGLVGRSVAMQDVYELLGQLSSLESIVLITGESGTGKELVAEALHYGGVRAGKSLIKVNCSALSENLLESELFGHVKGAFTGAVRDKVGRIQAAQGGTLFLDEIGDISPLIQLKLLRFLEGKEYERVGDARTLSADVRIIAATNVDLREAVRQGRFREDLYYRLNVMPVHLPPLRERPEDIPLLVEHFLNIFSDQFGKSFDAVSEEVMDLFMGYRWPGNVRELRHALEHACILSPGKSVTLKHIRKDLVEQAYAQHAYPQREPSRPVASISPAGPLRRKPGQKDVLAVLAECGGNKVRAARRLGIHRATLYRKLKAWGVDG
ncbi:MAG: sigma 54-interacting transcriptional regulator [Desulfovibrionaceae bacterium]|nr:sigma 54-interacting transcriptional regulator [Desulfovibrionaceae bacterium]